jgi:hypothetical protein
LQADAQVWAPAAAFVRTRAGARVSLGDEPELILPLAVVCATAGRSDEQERVLVQAQVLAKADAQSAGRHEAVRARASLLVQIHELAAGRLDEEESVVVLAPQDAPRVFHEDVARPNCSMVTESD